MQPGSQPPISAKSESARRSAQLGSIAFPTGAFLIVAGTIVLLLIVLHCVWIVYVTFGPAGEATGGALNWLWSFLTLAVLALGGLNVHWGVRSLRTFNRSGAFTHFGVLLCCGLAAIGLQCLIAARALTIEPLLYDFSELELAGAKPSAGAAAPVPILAGDPAEGQKLFAVTCITCHGPTGDGLNNLAPSLRSSEFIKAADVAAIVNVVKRGRPAIDPNNKSGKVMPAKGGNPFLTDQQVAHLAAFVKGLPSAAAPSMASAAAGAAPAVQLSRWVLPSAKIPPAGLIALNPEKDLIGSEAIEHRNKLRRSKSINALGLLSLAVHGIFLSCLFLASSAVVFGWLLAVRRVNQAAWVKATNWGWLIALIAWATIVFVFLLI